MKPLRTRLQIERDRLGVPWETLERDYVLSWVLAGIASTEPLGSALVFKGGTALKKCYFGDYRFSEDLDFSTARSKLGSEVLETGLAEACGKAEAMVDEYAPVRLRWERQREREPHPGGQAAFVVRARLPWQGDFHTRIKVEITADEPILREPIVLPVLHGYEEPLAAGLSVYSLEEIVAEKLRALRQHMKVMEQRGWTRSRARDYYDLWRVLTTYGAELDVRGFDSFLRAKCDVRGVGFDGVDSFFEEPMLSFVRETWEEWLGHLVPNLPPVDLVLGELQPMLARLLGEA